MSFQETKIFHKAIKHWWATKKVTKSKRLQGGTRDANLHGKAMDGFGLAIYDFLIGLNVAPAHIFAGNHLARAPSILPSYFRPSKNWDLLVLANSRFHPGEKDNSDPVLYAAIEFKSQDKSIGNNQNNRLEESIGNAVDFWTTYAHSGFDRQQPRPWLGYLFVGKYDPETDEKSVKIKQPHFEAMPPFRVGGSETKAVYAGPSYAERYKIFLRQCVASRLYDAGAFLVTDESISEKVINHRISVPEFGPANFLRSLKAQILAHYPDAKIKRGSLASKI